MNMTRVATPLISHPCAPWNDTCPATVHRPFSPTSSTWATRQDHSPTRSRTVHYLLTHLTTLPTQPGLHLCRLGDLSWLLLLATLILGLYSAHSMLVPPLATTPTLTGNVLFFVLGICAFLFALLRVFTFLALFPFLLAFALLAFSSL